MTDLMDTFYSCACKILVDDILNQDGEYSSRIRYIDNELTRLSAVVDKDIASRFDELLVERGIVGELRECACFRAGFRMALELTR